MKKCVLVSGGAGFIGSHVTVELIEAGYDVIVADNMSNCDMTCFEGVKKITGRDDIPFVKMDFCDAVATELLFTTNHIDAVIHFAGFKAVGESVSEPLKYYHNNLDSFMTALVNPFCSMVLRPLMVQPPGVVTLSMAASGCSPVAWSNSTAPFTVWSTIFCASFALKPISTPPSTLALT